MTTAPHAATAGQVHSDGMPAAASRDAILAAGGPDRYCPSGDRPGDWSGSVPDTRPDRSAVVPRNRRTVRSWPLLVLAAPAAVAVWSGWVGIGQMTGFGEIHPLPGIWNSLQVNTAVTLPVGVEAYAAYALHAWLTPNPVVSDRTRRFARWSAIGSLMLGMAGQVAYHLLTEAHVTLAPWQVTTLVSCLPVLVLGMGTALAHMLRADASAAGQADEAQRYGPEAIPAAAVVPGPRSGNHADHDQGRTGGRGPMAGEIPDPSSGARGTGGRTGRQGPAHRPGPSVANRPAAHQAVSMRLAEAHAAAARLVTSGQRVSRRSLRAAGLHGSNADLGVLAGLVRSSMADATRTVDHRSHGTRQEHCRTTGCVPRLYGQVGEAGLGGQRLGVAGAQDPLADGQQGGGVAAGPGCVSRPSCPVGEVGPGGRGIGMVGAQDLLECGQQRSALSLGSKYPDIRNALTTGTCGCTQPAQGRRGPTCSTT